MAKLTPSSARNAVFNLAHRIVLAPRMWNASSRSLPDFLIIGAARSGTTSLFHLLCRHPQVMRSLYKEVNFFSRNYERGVNWYRAHFPTQRRKSNANALTGEASPSYLWRPNVPQRVKSLVPHCRFIALLRNPVDNLSSSYQYNVRLGRVAVSFEEAVHEARQQLEAALQSGAGDQRTCEPARLHSDFYHISLDRWFSIFPRDQLLILEYGEAFGDMQAAMEKICSHLRIRPWAPDREERRNTGSYPPMNPATRADLQKFFAPHNEKLYSLLGKSFPWD
jgi:hypothetical protein